MIDAHSVKFHNQLSPEKKNLYVIVWPLLVIFDQWPKLHLGLDALSNQKSLKLYPVYYTGYSLLPKYVIHSYLDTLA